MSELYNEHRKKQRGQKRKLAKILYCIKQFEPFTKTNKEYEHFHVPGTMFIEHNKTSAKIKKSFYKEWIRTAESFINQKPEIVPFCKVVALLSTPHLWSSEIIIFYDENYYTSFWERNTDYQKWTPIRGYSFADIHNLNTDLYELGIHEIIQDNHIIFEEELWFYGDVVKIPEK